MNKKHFSKYLADNLNISKNHANILIDAFTTNLNQAIFEGHSVSIDGFGSFIPTNNLHKKSGTNKTIKFIPSPVQTESTSTQKAS